MCRSSSLTIVPRAAFLGMVGALLVGCISIRATFRDDGKGYRELGKTIEKPVIVMIDHGQIERGQMDSKADIAGNSMAVIDQQPRFLRNGVMITDSYLQLATWCDRFGNDADYFYLQREARHELYPLSLMLPALLVHMGTLTVVPLWERRDEYCTWRLRSIAGQTIAGPRSYSVRISRLASFLPTPFLLPSFSADAKISGVGLSWGPVETAALITERQAVKCWEDLLVEGLEKRPATTVDGSSPSEEKEFRDLFHCIFGDEYSPNRAYILLGDGIRVFERTGGIAVPAGQHELPIYIGTALVSNRRWNLCEGGLYIMSRRGHVSELFPDGTGGQYSIISTPYISFEQLGGVDRNKVPVLYAHVHGTKVD